MREGVEGADLISAFKFEALVVVYAVVFAAFPGWGRGSVGTPITELCPMVCPVDILIQNSGVNNNIGLPMEELFIISIAQSDHLRVRRSPGVLRVHARLDIPRIGRVKDAAISAPVIPLAIIEGGFLFYGKYFDKGFADVVQSCGLASVDQMDWSNDRLSSSSCQWFWTENFYPSTLVLPHSVKLPIRNHKLVDSGRGEHTSEQYEQPIGKTATLYRGFYRFAQAHRFPLFGFSLFLSLCACFCLSFGIYGSIQTGSIRNLLVFALWGSCFLALVFALAHAGYA